MKCHPGGWASPKGGSGNWIRSLSEYKERMLPVSTPMEQQRTNCHNWDSDKTSANETFVCRWVWPKLLHVNPTFLFSCEGVEFGLHWMHNRNHHSFYEHNYAIVQCFQHNPMCWSIITCKDDRGPSCCNLKLNHKNAQRDVKTAVLRDIVAGTTFWASLVCSTRKRKRNYWINHIIILTLLMRNGNSDKRFTARERNWRRITNKV